MTLPTLERAKEVISYDPDTGLFTWLVTLSNRAQKGKIAGCKRDDGYYTIRIDGQKIFSHRLAWFLMTGVWPIEIDHRDTNTSNNKWSNLRETTHAQNLTNQNVHKDNVLGHKGIKQLKNGRYYVTIGTKSFGGHGTLGEACATYAANAPKVYGEFARL